MNRLLWRWTDEFPTLQANKTALAARLSKLRKPKNGTEPACDDDNSTGADTVVNEGWEDIQEVSPKVKEDFD